LQRCWVKFENGKFKEVVVPPDDNSTLQDHIHVRAGCTLIFDLDLRRVKYVVSKPLIHYHSNGRYQVGLDKDRFLRQYQYQFIDGPKSMNEFHHCFGGNFNNVLLEPFCFVHNH
jgi:hypothetical protein